jgi:hypothetical protein
MKQHLQRCATENSKPVALMRDDAWPHGREGAAALAEERRNGHEER